MGIWLLIAAAMGDPVTIPVSGAEESYRIDRIEVSVDQFEAFVESGGFDNLSNWSDAGKAWLQSNPAGQGAEARRSARDGSHPVVAVTRFEAEAYCAAQGGRLPTGEQWARAVCAEGGPYPWGAGVEREVQWFAEGKYGQVERVATQPVESGVENASPLGLVHGAGNVWEWTSDERGAGWGTLRGGSYMNLPSYCTCDREEWARPDEARLTAGFRCAWQ